MAMDTVIPGLTQKKWRRRILLALILIVILALLWFSLPKGYSDAATDLRIATVEQAIFKDELQLRATAILKRSVVLDAVESGRVEEVLVKDGEQVTPGQLLFRLSNSQRQLELLQRKSEHTQQVSNLANLQVGFQASASEQKRRLSALAFEQQAKRYRQSQINFYDTKEFNCANYVWK